jgi:hypothetical protein
VYFLYLSGITAMQPFKPRGKEVFHVSYKNVENDILVNFPLIIFKLKKD